MDLESRGIYMYLCSKSKGANQLCGYTAADLYLWFSHIFKKQVFSWRTSINDILYSLQVTYIDYGFQCD